MAALKGLNHTAVGLVDDCSRLLLLTLLRIDVCVFERTMPPGPATFLVRSGGVRLISS